jgi:hypothetical protein
VERKEPLGADATEAIVEDRLRAVKAEGGTPDTLTVKWREAPKSLLVVTMPLDNLLYNPDTHRIRAQRDFDPTRDKAIEDDPWGTTAQGYLDYLLSALPSDPGKPDPAFDKLKEDLDGHGQKDPGIITPSGILINGNTRCAALRKLNAKQMKVAVLPSDWTWDDISAIELDLQMTKDYRRDYSFINYLLALDEAVGLVGAEEAMKSFRIQKGPFNRALWILTTLQDLVKQSTEAGGAQLYLRDFENDQGKLEELYRAYTAKAKSDPDAADLLRESRLLALLMDKSKTDIRLIDEDFLERYLKKQLPEDFQDLEPSKVAVIPGLGRPVQADTPAVAQVRALVKVAAAARAAVNRDPESAAHAAAIETFKSIDRSLEQGLDAAGKNARLKKSQSAAIDRINDAADGLDLAIEQIADAKSRQALDEAALSEALVNLRQAMTRFATSTARMLNDESEGVSWLNKVRKTSDDRGRSPSPEPRPRRGGPGRNTTRPDPATTLAATRIPYLRNRWPQLLRSRPRFIPRQSRRTRSMDRIAGGLVV